MVIHQAIWLSQRLTIQELFQECGEVIQVRLPYDVDEGHLKGFGYVEFASAEAKESAIALNGRSNPIDRKLVGHSFPSYLALPYPSFPSDFSKWKFYFLVYSPW